MIGYHYSDKELKIGDRIISNQHKSKTYELVWNVFKNKNKNLPFEFGYAYHQRKHSLVFKHLYIVEADQVIMGNLNHSVYFTIDCLSHQFFQKDKTISLKKRIELRNEWLEKQAQKYFYQPTHSDCLEVISDNWIIKEIIY